MLTPHSPKISKSSRSAPHILTLVALSGLAALSMNVFLPSLPGMARGFGVDYGVMQLSVSAYLAMCALLQLLAGPVSDLYGRRSVMLGALLIFLVATAGTLLAPTAGWFLIFRMLQAVVASGLVISRAVVRDMFPADQAASRIGYVTMGMAIVPMIAPILGGVLDEAFGWRANFSMMGVLGLVVLIVCWLDMGETVRGGGVPMRQQLATYPVLARSQRFWGYALAATLASGSFFAYLGGAPFIGETLFHLSPAEVGYWFAAPSVGYAIGNFLSARFSVRVGLTRMILAGSVFSSLALLVALAGDLLNLLSPTLFFSAVAVTGLGNGMTMPNANAGMMSVRPELAGTASGLGGAMAVGGGALLSALVGALLSEASGAVPLLAIMALSSVGSVLAVLWVMAREKRAINAGS